MKLLPNVSLRDLQSQMVVALMVAGDLFNDFGADLIVTSANDGAHKVGSLHYMGKAVDLRTKHVGQDGVREIITKLRLYLPGFDVLLEDPDGPNQHLHVEFDDKRVNDPQEKIA